MIGQRLPYLPPVSTSCEHQNSGAALSHQLKGIALLEGSVLLIRAVLKIKSRWTRGELRYLAPLGSENISAPYFKQYFFQGGGYYPPDSQKPRLSVPRQK